MTHGWSKSLSRSSSCRYTEEWPWTISAPSHFQVSFQNELIFIGHLHSPSSLVTWPLYSGTNGRRTSFIKTCSATRIQTERKTGKYCDDVNDGSWAGCHSPKSTALLSGTVSWGRCLDRGRLWSFLDDRPTEPMDSVAFCMFGRMVSIERYSSAFATLMAAQKWKRDHNKQTEIIFCADNRWQHISKVDCVIE